MKQGGKNDFTISKTFNHDETRTWRISIYHRSARHTVRRRERERQGQESGLWNLKRKLACSALSKKARATQGEATGREPTKGSQTRCLPSLLSNVKVPCFLASHLAHHLLWKVKLFAFLGRS